VAYRIKIESEASRDIQEGIDWYNEQQANPGRKFHSAVKNAIAQLMVNPFYQIRYDEVRCLPLKKFPFMVHFTVDEVQKLIVIRAVFNTVRDDDKLKT